MMLITLDMPLVWFPRSPWEPPFHAPRGSPVGARSATGGSHAERGNQDDNQDEIIACTSLAGDKMPAFRIQAVAYITREWMIDCNRIETGV